MTQTFRATAQVAGERLDRAVSSSLGLSRAHAQRLVEGGHVTVDGRAAAKSQRLVAGQVVTVTEPAPQPGGEPPPVLAVRHEDEHLAVVSKPAGLVVHAGAGTSGPTLVDALQAMGVALADTGDPARPGIVHRLDRGTSGLLVIAKSDAARAELVRLFKAHRVQRRYWALVDGTPDPQSATIEAPIARDPGRRTRFRVDPAGRAAVSHYDVEQSFAGVARVAVRLETGRTHQVRVHLAAIGHPVTADIVYGADPTIAASLGLERPALHAAHLEFRHPMSGVPIGVEEPLPADLEHALEALRASAAD